MESFTRNSLSDKAMWDWEQSPRPLSVRQLPRKTYIICVQQVTSVTPQTSVGLLKWVMEVGLPHRLGSVLLQALLT